MKRVLVVFHDCHRFSGASASMLDLIDSLRSKNDVEIKVVFPNDKGDMLDEIKDRSLDYFICKYHSCRYLANDNLFDKCKSITKAIAKFMVTLFAAYKFSRNNHEYDYIYSNTSDIYFGMFLSIFSNKKHIWHVREFGIKDQHSNQIIGNDNFYQALYKYSDAIIVISESLKNYILTKVKDNKAKVIRIYDDLQPTNELGDSFPEYTYDTLNLLVVGTISPGKGQEFIIDCISKLKDKGSIVNLAIAGHDESNYALYLKDKVKQLGIEEQVSFLGFQRNISEVRKNYNAAIIASSSEAFGRVTIEAMNAHQLTIANNAGANCELISHGETGFIFQKGDQSSLISLIEQIYQLSPDSIKEITNRGNIFSNEFMVGNAGNAVYELLSKLEAG